MPEIQLMLINHYVIIALFVINIGGDGPTLIYKIDFHSGLKITTVLTTAGRPEHY